jgi:adenosylmethionine-8-amino-7-oxononanoate aminotransferase
MTGAEMGTRIETGGRDGAETPAVYDLVDRTMVDFMQMKAFAEDPLVLASGQGIRVTDVEGRSFIDGLSGTFCAALGHGNRELAEAGATQLHRLAMAAPTLATNDRALELIGQLLDLLPERYSVVKLLSGGSEATENAMKIARQFQKQTGQAGRYKILSHYRAYHGATGHAMAATGWPVWRAPYEPLAGGFVHLHTPDPYRPPFLAAPFEATPEAIADAYLRLVEETIELEGPGTIAALITEPVLMSAGVVIPPAHYLAGLRTLCDRYGILLIFDEIITAFGRLGGMFAADLFDVWPDILCLGKGLSGGYAPLSAVVLSRRVAEAFWGEPRDLVQFHSGHTYGANPVACAIGSAAIRQMVRDDIPGSAQHRGERLLTGLRALQDRHPVVGDVRGMGLLVGMEFVRDRRTRERFEADLALGIRIRDAARRRGLLLRASHWMVVLAPPLTIDGDEIDEVVGLLGEAVDEILGPLELEPAT